MKEQVVTDFSAYQHTALFKAVPLINRSMRGNPYFPDLADKARVVEMAFISFAEAVALAVYRGEEAMSRKETAYQTLLRALRIVGVTVNREANGNREMLHSSGFPLPDPQEPGGRE